MMDRMEQVCGRKLPLTALFAGATIEQLANALVKQDDTAPQEPVMQIQAGGSKPPLFFLHGDFTGAGLYCLNLARRLGPDQPVYAFHPSGADGKPFTPDIRAMAAGHLQHLRRIAPHGPYRLGGFCAGGYIAFEMAQQLAAQGEQVEQLILIEVAPARRVHKLIRESVNCLGALRGLGSTARIRLFERWIDRLVCFNAFRRASTGTQIRIVLERMCSTAGKFIRLPGLARRCQPAAPPPNTPRKMPRELGDAYLWAIAGYLPRRYAGPVSLILASDIQPQNGDPTLGWGRVAPQIAVYSVPGDHLSSITRYGNVLAERLKCCLAGAPSGKTAALPVAAGSRWETAY
jgi:thioesterase domain-containing protein